jgi:hypothetical protein
VAGTLSRQGRAGSSGAGRSRGRARHAVSGGAQPGQDKAGPGDRAHDAGCGATRVGGAWPTGRGRGRAERGSAGRVRPGLGGVKPTGR